MEQLSNMPLWAQILGWGVFMGLNGYIGATCPGLNLAVLALMGMFANRKVGMVLLIVSILITLIESTWYFLDMYATGMSTSGNTETVTFLRQGTGIINLFIAGIVFFILLSKFNSMLALPKWLTILVIILFYVAGAWAGVKYWLPVISHGALLAAVGLLVALCYTASAPFAIGLSTLLFLVLAGIWGTQVWGWNQERIKSIQQANIDAQFLQAAADNQQEKMTALWNQVQPNVKINALERALSNQNTAVIDFLAPHTEISSAIIQNALYQKNLEEFKALVKAGAPITPDYVEYAAGCNFLAAVQLLVENGVDINQENLRPLSKAVDKGYIEIAEYLLKTGKNSAETLNEALVKLCSSYNYNYRKTAQEKLAKLLLEYGAQANNQAGYFSKTPLQGASGENGSLSLVRLLVSKGADVNAQDADGTTALMQAVNANDIEIVKFLLQQGAIQTINSTYKTKEGASSQDGESALFRAKNAEMAKLLLANGAQISHTNYAGDSVLLNAVRASRSADLVQELLNNGADINIRNKHGESALWHAVANAVYEPARIETVKLLLAHGADVNVVDRDGKTPLMLAQQADNAQVIQLLKSAGAKE